MEGVLGGSIDIAQLVEKSAGPSIFRKRTPKVPTAVHIDNAASDDFTVVEVYTQDRIGVLFTITYALHRSGISIHLAKISTNVDQVADVFYVTDGEGKKIKDKETLERLRQILYQEVVPEDERETQSAH
jgi:[protein-PII] uridylyltransferase